MKFCGENKSNKADWFDPLGPNAEGQHASTGGPEARAKIFGILDSLYPRATSASDRAASATEQAASNPLWGQAQGQVSKNLNGQYLNPSPALTNALAETRRANDTSLAATRAATLADMSGQQAATRAASQRNGVSFGTGAQQAQDAQQAAVLGNLSRGEQSSKASVAANEANQLAENYARERGYQTSASAMAPGLASGQASLLQSVPGQYYGPLTQSAEIVRGLAGGGQAVQPTISREPGVYDYALQTAGAVSGAAGRGGW